MSDKCQYFDYKGWFRKKGQLHWLATVRCFAYNFSERFLELMITVYFHIYKFFSRISKIIYFAVENSLKFFSWKL